MTRPTANDHEAAARRQAIADRQAAELRQAKAAYGYGHRAYFAWVLVDRSGQEPPRVIHGYRDAEGMHPGPHELPAWTNERDMSRPLVHPKTGETLYAFRWEHQYRHLEAYQPQTAHQLAAARERRQRRRLDAERQALPLFADQLTQEAR